MTGGGIDAANGTLTLYDSTLSGNSASNSGGGIFSNVTTTLTNTIVAGDTAPNGADFSSGGATLKFVGNNIIGSSPSGFTIDTSNGGDTQIDGANATALATVFAGGLANNGGPTETILIAQNGIAQATGVVADLPPDTFDLNNNGNTTEPLPVDARGGPREFDNTVDIGAVELQTATSPIVTAAASPVAATEGKSTGTVTVATFTDADFANAAPGAFTATINWGDGTTSSGGVTAQGGGVFAVTGAHTYAEEHSSPYAIEVTVVDPHAMTGIASGSATVADAPLTATAATVTGVEGVALTNAIATFTDANPNATLGDFTATIAWGDGSTSSGVVTENSGVFAVSGPHTYAAAGSYAPVVTIVDAGGSTAQAHSSVVVDPAAPVITTLVGQPLNGQTVELRGTGFVGDTVDLFADGNTTAIVGTGTVGCRRDVRCHDDRDIRRRRPYVHGQGDQFFDLVQRIVAGFLSRCRSDSAGESGGGRPSGQWPNRDGDGVRRGR